MRCIIGTKQEIQDINYSILTLLGDTVGLGVGFREGALLGLVVGFELGLIVGTYTWIRMRRHHTIHMR